MYELDGLPLNDPAGRWVLNDKTGLRIVPARSRSGATIPGRDGVRPSLGSTFEAGSLSITLTVRRDTHGGVMGALEVLHGVLGQRRRLLPLVHDYGNGTRRVAEVEVLSSMEHDMVLPEFVRLTVLCSVPGVFWRDQATTDSPLALTASTAAAPAAGLAGSTAPVNDALIRIRGGFSSAYIEDVVTGDRVTINTAVPASEYVVIDAAAWTARRVTSDTWTGGANIIASVVSNRGSGPMIGLEPDFATGAGRIRLRAVGTGITGSPQAIIRAKRSFL